MNKAEKYRFEKLEEMPNGVGSIYYFPSGDTTGGKDGLIVKVDDILNYKSWMGVFAFGELTPKGLTGIYSISNFDKLYVISKGMGYWVSLGDPTDWGIIDCHPIIECVPIIEKDVIVFGEFTKIVAYKNERMLWKTKQLSFDNLKLLDVDDNFLRGEYYDIRTEKNETFEVNLMNGQCNQVLR